MGVQKQYNTGKIDENGYTKYIADGQNRMNIKEIARVAGVSPATISRVLNGSGM